MGTSASDKARKLGALGRTDLYWLLPERTTIVTDKSRKLWDFRLETPMSERRVRSIQKRGVIVPIIIRTHGEDENGYIVEIVDGRDRVRCAREANRRILEAGGTEDDLIRVPCTLRNGDEGDLAVIGVVVNHHRRQDDLIESAVNAQRFVERGYSHEEIAEFLDCSEPTVAHYLTLMECDKSVVDAVRDQMITLTEALAISSLTHDKQSETIERLRAIDAKYKEAHQRANAPWRPKAPGEVVGNAQAPEGEVAEPTDAQVAQLTLVGGEPAPRAAEDSLPTTDHESAPDEADDAPDAAEPPAASGTVVRAASAAPAATTKSAAKAAAKPAKVTKRQQEEKERNLRKAQKEERRAVLKEAVGGKKTRLDQPTRSVKEIRALYAQVGEAMERGIMLGHPPDPVALLSDVLGWVLGDEQGESLATMVRHVAESAAAAGGKTAKKAAGGRK